MGNEKLRLSFLLAHCIANGERKLTTLFNVCTFHLTQSRACVPRVLLFFLACIAPCKAGLVERNLLWRGTLEKGFFSVILKLRERPSCCCKQCAKAEPKISSTSAWNRSTVCSCWRLAQGRACPVEVCPQGKCDKVRLQKTAVRQASVWCAASGSCTSSD